MILNFKTWLLEASDKAASTIRDAPGRYLQSTPQGKRYAGWRDVRWGYGFHKGNQPSLPARVGSDVIAGMGNVFRKRMGAGFPVYGSGYHSFFDPLTKSFNDGKDFIVVHDTQYNGEDDEDHSVLDNLAQAGLEKIRKMSDVVKAGSKAGVDISQKPVQIQYESGEKENSIRIIYKFGLVSKLTDKLRLTNAADEE